MLKYTSVILGGLLLAAIISCGPTRKFENSFKSYEDTVVPVKNMLLIINNVNIQNSNYKRFEMHLSKQLNQRGVAIRYIYFSPDDATADAKLLDTVNRYHFDFIIKQRLKVYYNTDNGIATTYDSRTPKLSNVLFVTMLGINANFTGYRKKGQYHMVWTCSCDVPNGVITAKLTENAANCLVKSLSDAGLVAPALPTK
jgi:hypothetical protein